MRNHHSLNRNLLDFHGLLITMESSDELVLEHFRRDFAFFVVPQGDTAPAGLTLRAVRERPDFETVPDLEAAFISPRNVVYRDGSRSYLDYFGGALLVEEPGLAVATSDDVDLLREILYLWILARVGLHLDRKGLHRIHAAGLVHQGRAVLLLCPSGGGKSTVSLNLLGLGDYRMLSEDSPLVDSAGDIHPFPLCLGCKTTPPGVPKRFLREVRRMEFAPKTLIDLEYFQDRLQSTPVPPGPVLVGVRHSGKTSRIEPLSRSGLLKVLFRDLVVGMGIYQGVEFLFQSPLKGLLRHAFVMASRLRSALALARRGRPYLFRMGCDVERNTRVLDEFLRKGQRPEGKEMPVP